jgi:hypothetical protein
MQVFSNNVFFGSVKLGGKKRRTGCVDLKKHILEEDNKMGSAIVACQFRS